MPNVNPEILRWARISAGLSTAEACRKLPLKAARGIAATDRLEALEAGDNEPTRPMLVKMSKIYRRSLLTFYLNAPPATGDRGEDFRTLPGDPPPGEEALLDALIRGVRTRQAMVRSLLEDDDDTESLAFVGSCSMDEGVEGVLAAIRVTLEVDLGAFREQPTPRDAFAYLRDAAEGAGIFVLLVGDLGSHHTALSVDTFRGYALADNIAPFVIVNDRDSPRAWSFTLLHELSHLWLGRTGVSGGTADRATERFCNDVAAGFLLPAGEIDRIASEIGDAQQLAPMISSFAQERKLSSSMVAYRLFRLGLLDRSTWQELRSSFRKHWQEAKNGSAGGPSYYVLRKHRLGNALLDLAGRSLANGDLTTTKAARVLGVAPKNVQALVQNLG